MRVLESTACEGMKWCFSMEGVFLSSSFSSIIFCMEVHVVSTINKVSTGCRLQMRGSNLCIKKAGEPKNKLVSFYPYDIYYFPFWNEWQWKPCITLKTHNENYMGSFIMMSSQLYSQYVNKQWYHNTTNKEARTHLAGFEECEWWVSR